MEIKVERVGVRIDIVDLLQGWSLSASNCGEHAEQHTESFE